MPPWLVGLSAIATYCSGYMFVGQIGYTYTFGLSSVWVMFGFIVGDFLVSILVHQRLHQAIKGTQNLTYLSAFEHMAGCLLPWYRKIAGVLITLFLCGYAAAQFGAGSKALYVLFGWPYEIGAVIGALMVLVYCWAGGIRASIWTDVAQAVVMLTAMGVLAYQGVLELGGVLSFWKQLHSVSVSYMDWFRPETHTFDPSGPWLFMLGWLVAGMGVVSQPHVMTRFMTLADEGHDKKQKDLGADKRKKSSLSNMFWARAWYYAFYIIFYILTLGVSLTARLILPEISLQVFDAELALPLLAEHLLSPLWVGLILAGLFASTMSTADSQVLCCTACITEDVRVAKGKPSYLFTKMVTVAVTALALLIALKNNQSVFDLVNLSAGTMASLFSPLLIVLCLKTALKKHSIHLPVNEFIAFLMMAIGAVVHLYFRFYITDALCYEVLPGIVSGLITYALYLSIARGKVNSSLRTGEGT